MDPVSLAASILALIGATTKTIKYLSDVKDAPNERKVLLQEAINLLPLFISLKNQVEEHNHSEPWSEGLLLLNTDHGALNQLQEGLEMLAKKLKPEKAIKKLAHKLTWTLDKAECDEILKKIERVKSTISLALQGNIYKLTQAIKAETAGIDTVTQGMTKLHIKEAEKERMEILAWFSPLNFFKSQQDIFGRREEGTGTWLIELPKFQDWVAGSRRTLCCAGIAGAGKSVLASVVVSHLRQLSALRHSVGIAAAYCNFKDRDMQSLENLLAGLCVQLASSSESLPKTLTTVYSDHRANGTRPTLKEIFGIFEETAKPFTRIYLIVDALDECSTEVRSNLVEKLINLQPSVRLLVTTRFIDSITSQFNENAIIEIRASRGDLEKYVRSRLAASSRLPAMLNLQYTSLSSEICDKVAEHASGMFLAAKLHMDSLSTKTSVKALKKAIQSLPKEIDELYDEVFRRIDTGQSQDARELALRALRWVAYAYRPLKTVELQVAVAIEPDDKDIDVDGVPEIAFILEACAGLLIVEKVTNTDWEYGDPLEVEQIRLVHYTAQTYLDALSISRFENAHASMASDCITYLSYDVYQLFDGDDEYVEKHGDDACYDCDDKESGSSETDDESDNQGGDVCSAKGQVTFALLRYASKAWPEHYIAGHGNNFSSQLRTFLASAPRVWLPKRGSLIRGSPDSPAHLKECTGLGIAAFLGLHHVLKHLLQNEIDIDEVTYGNSSALKLAMVSDDRVTTELLLEQTTDIENPDSTGETRLIYAMKSESMEAARLLIEKGANVSIIREDWGTPFANVRCNSPISFFQVLLDRGADINSRDSSGCTQLMARAMGHSLEIVKWLLDKGALVNLISYIGDSALLLASQCGSIDIVDLLLNYGADMSVTDSKGNSLLHLAYNQMDTALFKHYLALGIDVDATDGNGCSTLHHAARGNLTAIQELVRYGVDPDKRSAMSLTLKFPCANRIIYPAEPWLDVGDGDSRIMILSHRIFFELAQGELIQLLDEEYQGHELRLWEGGMTPLDISILWGDVECIEYLRSFDCSRTDSEIRSIPEYICEHFSCLSVEELREKLAQEKEGLPSPAQGSLQRYDSLTD